MGLGYRHYQKKLWKTRLIIGVLAVCCVLLLWSVIGRWQVEREMADRRAAVEADYAAVEERYNTLKEEVRYLTDERSLEAEIRKHFDVAKEGESVVIILDSERTSEPEPVATTTPERSTSWWPW